MYIFISHSSINADVAQNLCNVLESNGNGCFIAPRDIRTGYIYAEEIIEGIDRAEAMILVLSKESNESPHVLREIERAVSRRIPIIVYKIEEVVLTKSMEYFLMTHQWLNAKPGDYEQVLRSIEGLELSAKAKAVSSSPVGLKETSEAEMVKKASMTPVPAELNENTGEQKTKIGVLLGITSVLAIILIILIVMLVGKYSDSDSEKDTSTTQVSDQTEGQTENQTTPPATEQTTTGEDVDKPKKEIKVGDTISLGTYNDEEILWKVLKISEDGSEAVLITEDIITMKAYDVAESGEFIFLGGSNDVAADDYEGQIQGHGNSDWETSNIRTWLNSESGIVTYLDHPPTRRAMAEHKNGYENEPGFLTNFSDDELAAIKYTELETKGNALRKGETIITNDRVFVLSVDELAWFITSKVNILAKPTKGALDQDESQVYEYEVSEQEVDEFAWWLREPVEDRADYCYMVCNGYYEDNIRERVVGVEGYGIRPAITVDLNSDALKVVE